MHPDSLGVAGAEKLWDAVGLGTLWASWPEASTAETFPQTDSGSKSSSITFWRVLDLIEEEALPEGHRINCSYSEPSWAWQGRSVALALGR